MRTGCLLGIARKARSRAAMETVEQALIAPGCGVFGDYRGSIPPGRSGSRQVSILSREDWEAALAELGRPLDWTVRRANLLVAGLVLPRWQGARLRIGAGALLEIMGECDPCSRMEEAASGLKAVLMPEWRGGRVARVLAEGEIRIGDSVMIEEVA